MTLLSTVPLPCSSITMPSETLLHTDTVVRCLDSIPLHTETPLHSYVSFYLFFFFGQLLVPFTDSIFSSHIVQSSYLQSFTISTSVCMYVWMYVREQQIERYVTHRLEIPLHSYVSLLPVMMLFSTVPSPCSPNTIPSKTSLHTVLRWMIGSPPCRTSIPPHWLLIIKFSETKKMGAIENSRNDNTIRDHDTYHGVTLNDGITAMSDVYTSPYYGVFFSL